MPEAQIDLPLQTRSARVRAESVNSSERTVEVVWSTGTPVRRQDWRTGRSYDEVLSLDDGHVNLARLNAGAPVLDTHAAFALLNVLGVVERAWIDRDGDRAQGRAVLRFSDRAEVEPVWRDIAGGILRNISVGYIVRAFAVDDEDRDVPLWRAVDWEPAEVSVVPIGADPNARVRGAAISLPSGPLIPSMTNQRSDPMDGTAEVAVATRAPELAVCDECMTPAKCRADETCASTGAKLSSEAPPAASEPAAPDGVPAPEPAGSTSASPVAAYGQRAAASDTDALMTRAVQAERTRIAGIYDAQGKLGLDRGIADDLVRRGATLDEARQHLIDRAAGASRETATRPHIAAGHQDERVTRRQAVENAILHRFDPAAHALDDAGREWRGYSLLEMARAFLEAESVRTRGLSRDQVATRALHSTSDFPHILAAVANKTLRKAYEAAPRTFMPICRQVSASDFKEIHRVQLGEAPALEKVRESGVFKRGTIGEGKESYRVETYGKIFGISRQVIINDDLDAFTRVPQLFGTSAANLESDVVWGIFIDNPKMGDGVVLFHTATHRNLASAGSKLDVEGIGKGRASMAAQKGLDGKTILNIRPSFLIVPAALELAAEQLLAQNLVPAQTANVVPTSIRSLAVIAEPRLDAASQTAWYLASNPAQIDTIEYAYLEGQAGVYIETRMGFDVDGVEIKARLDFGAKAIDWRGFYKDPGSAS